jgi:energy-coupling factor transport system permease protein
MKSAPTRFLLTVAAIGVGGGIIGIPNAFLFNALAIAAPAFLGLAAGFYVLPGIVAQAALRRPGVGLLAQLLAGLVAAPFVPTGILSVIAWVMLGVLIELPFAILLYRYWARWYFYVSGAWVAVFYSAFWGVFYDTASLGALTLIGQPVMLLASMAVFTTLALAIARGVERTGVLRGLQAPVTRVRVATEAAS